LSSVLHLHFAFTLQTLFSRVGDKGFEVGADKASREPSRTRRIDDVPELALARSILIVSGPQRGKEPLMVEIPKITIIERIRSRSGPEAADSANDELPEKLDLDSDSDARLLRRYDIEPDELREEFGRGSPSTG
jgi:hypothetical protein